MGTFVDDATAAEDENPIRNTHRRQAMGDDEGRSLPSHLLDRAKDEFLRDGIERRCRLIENEDRRILARAMLKRCFSPPDKPVPASARSVS